MLDRILYLLFRRKTGLVLLGAATILFAMAFGGCFTLSMCACGLDKCADVCSSYGDRQNCLRDCADSCNACDKEYSCKSGCDVFDCAFGYGFKSDCKNGVIECGGCNSTCFTDCANDCSGSTCNGCETCYFSFSNCKYRGDATVSESYFVKIRLKVVDDSGNEITTHAYEQRFEASELTFKDNLTQIIDLGELGKELDALPSFHDYFERPLTFGSDNEGLDFKKGQYEATGYLEVTVPERYWSKNYGGSTVEIIAKAHEKGYGNPVSITVDYSSASRKNEYFTVNVGSVPAYTAPDIAGYEFLGFFTKDGENEIPFDMSKPFHAYAYNLSGLDMSMTIYAKYEMKRFTLTIIKTTAGVPGSETLRFEALYNEFAYATLERLKTQTGVGADTEDAFFKWFAYDADGNNAVGDTDIIREDRTIYCRYVKKLTLTLYGVDGNNKGAKVLNVGYGDEIDNPIELPVPADYDRFSFLGWYADEAFTVRVRSGMPITEDTAFYAKWDEASEFKIYFYTDKASFEANNVFHDTTFDYKLGVTLPVWEEVKNSFTVPESYVFVGWKKISSTNGFTAIGDTVYTEFRADVTSPEDYYLVAEFKKSVLFIVSPESGSFEDGSPTSRRDIYLYGKALPTPVTKEAYEFGGWSLTPNEPYDIVNSANAMTKLGSADRLYAKFSAKTFTLVFINDDSDTAEKQRALASYGKAPTPLPYEPSKVGHTFDGWFDKDGNKFDETAPVTADAVYTAKFTRKTYTITLIVKDSDGNESVVGTREILYGEKIDLGRRSGYFLCWEDADGKAWTDSSGSMLEGYDVDGDVTLYAHFI